MQRQQRSLLIVLGLGVLTGVAGLLWVLQGDLGDPGDLGTELAVERSADEAASSARAATSGSVATERPELAGLSQGLTRVSGGTGGGRVAVIVADAAGAPLPNAVVALRRAAEPDATGPDATGADATGADATGADATGADASGADASGAGEGRLAKSDDPDRYLEGIGTTNFDGVLAGTWTLEVSSEGLLTQRRDVNVVDGKTTREVVQLDTTFEVRGRLLTRFGTPFRNAPVWFLKKRKTHPEQTPRAVRTLGAEVNASGEFTVRLDENADYRISVGPIGEVICAMEKPRRFHAGEDLEVEVVVPGATYLEVHVDDAPDAVAEGKSSMRVAVLFRPADMQRVRGRSRPLSFSDDSRLERGKKKEGRGSGDRQGGRAAPQPQGAKLPPNDSNADASAKESAKENADTTQPDSQQPDSQPDSQQSGKGPRNEWAELEIVPVPVDGCAVFRRLPAEIELRLALVRRKDQFESETTFVLPIDRRSIAHIPLPPRRSKEQIAEQRVGRITPYVEYHPATKDDRKPGFYWSANR